ncbi:MAG: phosphopantothenoylcysteine decarboxylase [Candidatus Omnitrophica bacterium]|nr:phosphopantothenoylcysteine decarboxylase [Candidatus Omnitrophota bacterium]
MKYSVHGQESVVYRNDKRFRLLITAGPTQEPLDPVRFISNYSTGTMGYFLARQAQKLGYKVILISGPVNLPLPEGVKYIPVKTAEEMYRETRKFFLKSDCLIMTAAVCDFRPAKLSQQKIKKRKYLNLKLVQTRDILCEMGKIKGKRVIVGFALETENLIKNSREKIKDKNMDLIIANKVNRRESPFGKNNLKPFFIFKDGTMQKIAVSSKSRLARTILRKIEMIR